MPLNITIDINGVPVTTVRVRNIEGRGEGDCVYEFTVAQHGAHGLEYRPGITRTKGTLMHRRSEGAAVLAAKVMEEVTS